MAIRENSIHAPPLPSVKAPTASTFGSAPIKSGAAQMPKLGGFSKPPKLNKGGT